jgi:hypothetical protein
MRRDEPFLAPERRTLPGHAGALLRAVLRGLWRAVVVIVTDVLARVARPLRLFLLGLILFSVVMAVVLLRHHQFGLAAMTFLVAAIAYGIRQWLGRFVVGVIVL